MEKFMMLPKLMIIIILLTIFKFISGHPVTHEEQLNTTTKFQNFNVVKSILITPNDETIKYDDATNKMKRTVSKQNLPLSPIELLRPDTFQFYTFNQNGDVVMKQMSKKEIQSLIASSGGHFPMETHEIQKVEDVLSGEAKVADVVQNVQNVLKSELNKPIVITSMPTIPGHDNSEWSNILPSILSGDTESDATIKSDHSHNIDLPEIVENSQIFDSIKSESNDTKPMVPITVITVEQQSSTNHYNKDKEETNEMPVFQILNTLIANNDSSSITLKSNLSSVNNLELDKISNVSKTDIMFKATSSITSYPNVSSNCSHHHLEMTDEPYNIQQSNKEAIDKNKNDTVNEIDVIQSLIAVKPVDKIEKNPEEMKPSSVLSINITEIMDNIEKTVQINNGEVKNKESEKSELIINTSKNNTEVNLSLTSDKKNEIHFEEITAISLIETSTFSQITDKLETTSVNNDNLVTYHSSNFYQDEMSTMKTNSSIIEQILIDNSSDQLKNQTINLPIDNNQNNNFISENLNISQIDKSEIMIDHSDILSLTTGNFSNESLVNTKPLVTLNTTLLTNLSQINEKKNITEIKLTLLTTPTPMQQENFTSHNSFQSINKKINNSNSSTTINEFLSFEKYSLPTVATTTIHSDDTTQNSVLESTETIQSELVDSLTSVISQVSQIIPSIVPTSNNTIVFENSTDEIIMSDKININKTKSEEPSVSEKNIINIGTYPSLIKINQTSITTDNLTTIKNNIKLNIDKNDKFINEHDKKKGEIIEKISETPIVRIDIMETIPNIDKQKNITLINKNINNNTYTDNDDNDNDEKTESPMVRIKLTDPISALHQILELSPVQSSTQYSLEIITLPTDGNYSANGIASGLIANYNTSTNESLKNLELNNKTTTNVNNTTQKFITTISSKIEEQTNFDTTKIPIFNTSNVNTESIIKFSSTNEMIIKNKTAILEKNNTVLTDIDEIKFIKPLLKSTTVMSNVTTESIVKNLMVNSSITESPVTTVYDTTYTIISQMPNKILSYTEQTPMSHQSITTLETIEIQHSTDKTTKLSSLKSDNSTLNLNENFNFKQPHDNLTKHSLTTFKLSDTIQNISIITPIKIKDKKKDDTLLGYTDEKLIVSETTESDLKSIKKSTLLNKINSTKDITNTSVQWTLIPQGNHTNLHNNSVEMESPLEQRINAIQKESEKTSQINGLSEPKGTRGLDLSVEKLDADISYFSILCNNLAFTYWNTVNSGLSTSRSLALSPFGMTSMLAMIFLGARSPTSDRMNDILKLDDVTSFNPHLIFQNVTDSVGIAQNQGIANVAFVRELFTDQSKVRKLMRFYKKQAEQFYDGMVEQVNFSTISDTIRRKTNFLIRKQTGGRIRNFIKTNTVSLRSPLGALSANVFQTDCNSDDATSMGRDGELYFAVSPVVRQRKLVLVPATLWKTGVLAGYEPSLDATAIALGNADNIVSTIFVIPGQQGFTASDDNLDLLEQRIISGALHDGAWNKLLKVIVPRPGLELQIPKFSHKSVINATSALKMMGLEELFLKCADFKGINGVGNDFHLADMVQINLFSTCGDENIQSGKTKHHVEIYPASPQRNARESKYNDEIELNKNNYSSLKSVETNPSLLEITRQRQNQEKPRVKLDKPFLYFVRHNPTGLILFMGRFNPRLLP